MPDTHKRPSTLVLSWPSVFHAVNYAEGGLGGVPKLVERGLRALDARARRGAEFISQRFRLVRAECVQNISRGAG